MSQKIKIVFGAVLFLLLISAAAFAYDTLRDDVAPELMLADEPGNIVNPRNGISEESDLEEESAENGNVSDGNAADESQPQEPEKMKAPDFTVEKLDGGSVKLSDMVGAPVVLNFWASWCPPCKAEMPDFDNVYAELGDEVTFMMVNMTDGQRETKEKGDEYISEQGFSFPVYYDTNQEAAYTYGIRSIPTTIFIDSEGFIVTGAEGQITEEILRYGISMIYSE